MKITVIRSVFNGSNTIGRMFIDGKFFAYTLEDIYRIIRKPEDKVKGQTAIPYGTYKAAVTFSNRFQKNLPELYEVPYFTGIRIHGGNTEADTEGCILIGAEMGTDEKTVRNCKRKVDELIARMQVAKMAKQEITVEIKPEFPV